MFKINNKDTRTKSMTLRTYFTPFSSVFVVNFEQVNVSWVTIRVISQNIQALTIEIFSIKIDLTPPTFPCLEGKIFPRSYD